jgi:hypothetical protein
MITDEPAGMFDAAPEMKNGPFTLLTEARQPFQAYRITALPHTLFFDTSGALLTRLEGFSPNALEGIGEKLESMPRVR